MVPKSLEMAKAILPIIQRFKNIVAAQWAAMQQSNIRIF